MKSNRISLRNRKEVERKFAFGNLLTFGPSSSSSSSCHQTLFNGQPIATVTHSCQAGTGSDCGTLGNLFARGKALPRLNVTLM